jgi:hypothetical protein
LKKKNTEETKKATYRKLISKETKKERAMIPDINTRVYNLLRNLANIKRSARNARKNNQTMPCTIVEISL